MKVLDEVSFGRTEPMVRVNAVTSDLIDEDLKVTLSAKNLPPTLLLPKVDDPSHIQLVSQFLC